MLAGVDDLDSLGLITEWKRITKQMKILIANIFIFKRKKDLFIRDWIILIFKNSFSILTKSILNSLKSTDFIKLKNRLKIFCRF
jgi:hypothetical protein